MRLGPKTLKIVPKFHATMEHLTKLALLPALSKHDLPTENGLHVNVLHGGHRLREGIIS